MRPIDEARARTKTAATMEARYVNMSSRQRMEAAVKLVLDGKVNQSEAARKCGVDRSHLNRKLSKLRQQQELINRRSAQARAERVEAFERTAAERLAADDVTDGTIVPEVLAVPDEPELVVPELWTPDPPKLEITNEIRRVPPITEFVRMYFGNVICPDCGVHHDVPGFHDEILTLVADPAVRRLLVNVAPYHAKSTIGTVYGSLYEICKDPNIRIAIVSKATRLGGNFLYQIKRFLTDSMLYQGGPSLIEDWGPFMDDNSPWSQTEIYVAGRSSSEKDPTVSVHSVGAQIYGFRFDIMKFDDVADLENQKNPERVAEMLRWATQECASRVGKSGRLQFFGTRVSPGDIYSHLENLPAYQVVRYPCILDEAEKTTLWPEHFPYAAAVEQRESMQLEQFQLVYQNIDTMGVGATFPLDVLERAQDPTRALGHYEPEWALVLGVDPAGANAQAGYTAMVVLGVDLVTGRRHLVDLVNHKQMKAPQIKDQIIDFAERYPLREIRVEVNGLQSQLFQYDVELIRKITNRGIRFVPHITGRNKWDAQFGVESMAPLFYNGLFSSPWGDIDSRRKATWLHEQLSQFPMGQVSDLVMALWFADLSARELFQRHQMPAFDMRANVPARLRRQRRVVDFSAGEVRPVNPGDVFDPLRPPETQRQLVNVPGSVGVSVW